MVLLKLPLHGTVEQLHVGVGKGRQGHSDGHQSLLSSCCRCGKRSRGIACGTGGRSNLEKCSSVNGFCHVPSLSKRLLTARFNADDTGLSTLYCPGTRYRPL